MGIDLSQGLKLQVEDVAMEFGKVLPEKLAKLEDWLRGKGVNAIADVLEKAREALEKAPSMLIETGAGVIQVPRGLFPKGKLGDTLHEYADEIVDEIGRGLVEAKKAGTGAKPADKGDKPKSDDKASADPMDKLGYVNNGRWYPADCTHVGRPWSGGGKGQPNKGPADITLKEALARGHGYCKDCVRDLAAPKSEPKPEAKAEETKAAPKEHVLPKADHTLFDLWRKLHDDVVERDGDDLQYRGNWNEFVRITEHDAELRGKFLEAFTKRGTYEQFKYLVLETPSKHWHWHLDHLLGSAKPSASYLQKKAEEERQQWAGAIRKVTAWLARSNVAGQEAIDKDKAELAALKARWQGESSFGKGAFITVASLAILLAAIFVIWQTLN